MKIYELTPAGYSLAHSVRPTIQTEEQKARWGVIYLLNRTHGASGERILAAVPDANIATLSWLARNNVIQEQASVGI